VHSWGFLVWDQAMRAMAKDPNEGPQYMTGVLGLGPSSKSLDVFYDPWMCSRESLPDAWIDPWMCSLVVVVSP
jgi:hypothetical protein